MKEEIKVLLSDDDREFCAQCAAYLQKAGCKAVFVPKDGNKIVEAILEHRPDAAMFDVFMPRLDGLGVIEDVRAADPDIKTRFILTAAYDNGALCEEVMNAGADFYLIRPLSAETVARRLAAFAKGDRVEDALAEEEESSELKLEREITEVMHQIGVPAHVKGYHYLREAILLSSGKGGKLESITKVIYPSVAKTFETTPSRVERAIRHAIEIAWDRGDVDTLNSYFGYTVNNARGKPTNSEFIAMISDYLHMKNKEKKSS